MECPFRPPFYLFLVRRSFICMARCITAWRRSSQPVVGTLSTRMTFVKSVPRYISWYVPCSTRRGKAVWRRWWQNVLAPTGNISYILRSVVLRHSASDELWLQLSEAGPAPHLIGQSAVGPLAPMSAAERAELRKYWQWPFMRGQAPSRHPTWGCYSEGRVSSDGAVSPTKGCGESRLFLGRL